MEKLSQLHKTGIEQMQEVINAFSEPKTKVLRVHKNIIPILTKELGNRYPKAKIEWCGLFGAEFFTVYRTSSYKTFK